MGKKYGNHEVIYRGLHFDSELERDRWIFLTSAQEAGKISGLRRQVRFELLPRVRFELLTRQLGHKTKTTRSGKTRQVLTVLEFGVDYIADFLYYKEGELVIEDTKGHKTRDYIIKRKLMRYQGHPIREVKRPGEAI